MTVGITLLLLAVGFVAIKAGFEPCNGPDCVQHVSITAKCTESPIRPATRDCRWASNRSGDWIMKSWASQFMPTSWDGPQGDGPIGTSQVKMTWTKSSTMGHGHATLPSTTTELGHCGECGHISTTIHINSSTAVHSDRIRKWQLATFA